MRCWKNSKDNKQKVLFFNSIKRLDDLSYLTYYLKYQLAPVIMGVKPAVTLNVIKKQDQMLSKAKLLKIVDELGLQGMILREARNSQIIFVYRREHLSRILNESKAKEVLKNLGYPPLERVYDALSHLRKRYDVCHCPPELGIFLGFPIEDVTDYMCGTSKKCLLCGYWQVYNNVSEAEKIFNRYDAAKAHMLTYLLDELEKTS